MPCSARHQGHHAANAPLSVLSAKLTVEEMLKDAGDRDMARVNAAGQRAMQSEDFKEGRRAFMEKRKPVWQGR